MTGFDKNDSSYVENLTNNPFTVVVDARIAGQIDNTDINIPPHREGIVPNILIEFLVKQNNTTFGGIDGKGTNAPLYIKDDIVRRHVFKLKDDQDVKLLTKELMKTIVDETNSNKFKKLVVENVVTVFDKQNFREFITDLYINKEFDSDARMTFIEEHVSFNIREHIFHEILKTDDLKVFKERVKNNVADAKKKIFAELFKEKLENPALFAQYQSITDIDNKIKFIEEYTGEKIK